MIRKIIYEAKNNPEELLLSGVFTYTLLNYKLLMYKIFSLLYLNEIASGL